jgi:23S rRNA pseudoU1915 N3-methylase RlmH
MTFFCLYRLTLNDDIVPIIVTDMSQSYETYISYFEGMLHAKCTVEIAKIIQCRRKKDKSYGCHLSQEGEQILKSIKKPDSYSKFIKSYVLNEDETSDIIISIGKSD